MKQDGTVVKLFGNDGIMGYPKLVKAAVDQSYALLWICPGLWFNRSSTMDIMHGLAWAKIPICYISSGTCKGNACLIIDPYASS